MKRTRPRLSSGGLARSFRSGYRAEDLVARVLETAGYTIVARRVRTRYGELDLVARRDASLHLIEVKQRTPSGFAPPEDAFTVRKRERLVRTAGAYLEQIGWTGPYQLDGMLLIESALPQLVAYPALALDGVDADLRSSAP